MLNNIWKIPIGDWSNDGHGKCDWFTVKSNFTVEEAREAYFKAVKESQLDIAEEIACEYENSSVSKKLVKLLPEFIQDLSTNNLIQMRKDNIYYVENSDDMAEIVCLFIQRFTPEFKYKIIEDSIPMLPFYGFDKKNRHIGHIGYGLFY